MPFWYQAKYIFLRTSRFFSLSSSSPIPHHQIMETQISQTGVTGSEWSRTTDILSDTSDNGTQDECRHQLVHSDAANAPTEHMTQDAHLKIVHKKGRNQNKK